MLTYLVLLYLMQRNDDSRQLSTYLPTTHLPSTVSPLFANTTNQLECYRRQSLHYTTYFKYRTRHQTSSCVLAETTYRGPCPPAHRMYLPSPARNHSQLVVYHLYLAPRLHMLYELYVAVAFQKLYIAVLHLAGGQQRRVDLFLCRGDEVLLGSVARGLSWQAKWGERNARVCFFPLDAVMLKKLAGAGVEVVHAPVVVLAPIQCKREAADLEASLDLVRGDGRPRLLSPRRHGPTARRPQLACLGISDGFGAVGGVQSPQEPLHLLVEHAFQRLQKRSQPAPDQEDCGVCSLA